MSTDRRSGSLGELRGMALTWSGIVAEDVAGKPGKVEVGPRHLHKPTMPTSFNTRTNAANATLIRITLS